MIPGIHEVQSLATKYSKAQLAQMAQAGMIDPTKAVMAGMMIDRISKQNMQAPQSTVAQDVMAPPAPQAPQMGMPPQAQQGQSQQAPSAGVSGIPAPNMERMAGGGIVAFGDGGDVPSYAGNTPWGSLVGGSGFVPGGEDQRALQRMQETQAQSEAENQARIQAIVTKMAQGVALSPSEQQVASMMKLSASGAQPMPAAAPKSPFPISTDTEMLARRQQGVGSLSTPWADARTNPAPAGAPGLTQPRPPVSAGPAATAPTTGLGGLGQTMREVNKASGMADLKAQYEKLPIEAEAANVREKTLAEQRPEYVPYDKYEKSLEKEAAGAEEKKADNFKMALINAGLAIAGGKSQYALSNIAEGAQVGTKQYAEGMKELDKAAKEREKALAEIEQARNLYSDKKYDRAEALERSANDRLMTAKEKTVAGVAGITGKTLEASTAIIDTHARIASAEKIAGMQNTIQREVNTIAKQNALDVTQAKTLVDASNKYLADFKDNAAYINKPEQLTTDAIAYGKKVALAFMPGKAGNPSQDPALAAALAKYKTTPGTK